MDQSITYDKILEMIANHEIGVDDAYKLWDQIDNSNFREEAQLLLCKDVWEEKMVDGGIEASTDTILVISNCSAGTGLVDYDEATTNKCIYAYVGSEYQKIDQHHYCIGLGNPEDFENMLEDVENCGYHLSVFVNDWSFENNKSVEEYLKDGIFTFFYMCKSILVKMKSRNIKFLLLYRKSNDASMYLDSISSFLKSIRLEQPRFFPKCIDLTELNISDPVYKQDVITLLKKELSIVDGYIDIKYANNKRYVKKLEEIKRTDDVLDRKKNFYRASGVYLITGGTGKIAKLLVQYLVAQYQANLILIGRRELTEKEENWIHELISNGVHIEYRVEDITDYESMSKCFMEISQKYECLDGIFHTAGVLQDSYMFQKSKDNLETVFQPKIYGTDTVLKCARECNVGFVVLFSSISAVLGNIGQCDYAYANAVMDAYARYLKEASRCKIISIDWPLWEDGGMDVNDQAKEAMKKSYGLVPMPSAIGMSAIADILQLNDESVITALYGFREDIEDNILSDSQKKMVINNVSESRKDGKDTYKERMVEYLKKVLAKVTKIQEENIDEKESFEYFGLDSITAMSIGEELESDFGELSKTLLFEYQNLNELAMYFIENHYDVVRNIFSEEEIIINKESENACEVIEKYEFDQRSIEDVQKFFLGQDAVVDKTENTRKMVNCDDIAIVGLSGQYPGASNLQEFWDNLCNGIDSITLIPRERWNYEDYYARRTGEFGVTNCKWGGFLKDMDKFDPLFFNISPNEACLMDPQERLFLETAWHVIEDAGYSRKYMDTNNVGVYVGVMYGQYQLLPAMVNGHNLGHTSIYASIANRVSYYLNLHGPSVAMDTMCSSSLTSIHMACNAIRNKECDLAIAGGVNITIHPDKYIFLSQGNFTSEKGYCSSFGEGGDGYVPSEGVGAILLKPLKKAIEDHDNIYAVIKGSSLNHGGKTSGYTVPNPSAQSVVIKDALLRSGIQADTISYIEAHGTGTSLGDPIEIRGLMNSIGEMTDKKQYCAIGSVKSNIGHAESAAGIAGITKILLQMQYKKLVPSIHAEQINSKIDFESTPFYLEQSLKEWNPMGYPRRAGISSFGAGGANAHILFEEYAHCNQTKASGNGVLILLSARAKEQLKEYACNLKEFIIFQKKRGKELSLEDIAYTLQIGREEMQYRMACIVSHIGQLLTVLDEYSKEIYGNNSFVEGRINRNHKSKYTVSEGQRIQERAFETKDYLQLMNLWLDGVEINWAELYRNNKPYRVSLPGYPFHKERYWIPEGENKYLECGVINTFIHRNNADLYQVVYETDLTRNMPFFITEKYLQSNVEHLLFSMMVQGAAVATNDRNVKIKDFIFGNSSLTLSRDTSLDIHFRWKGNVVEGTINGHQSNCEYMHCIMETYEFESMNHFKLNIDYSTVLADSGSDTVQIEEGVAYKKYCNEICTVLEVISSFKDTKKYNNMPLLFDMIGHAMTGNRYCNFKFGEIHILKKWNEVCFIVMKEAFEGKYDIYWLDERGESIISLTECEVALEHSELTLVELLKQIEQDEIDDALAKTLLDGFVRT